MKKLFFIFLFSLLLVSSSYADDFTYSIVDSFSYTKSYAANKASAADVTCDGAIDIISAVCNEKNETCYYENLNNQEFNVHTSGDLIVGLQGTDTVRKTSSNSNNIIAWYDNGAIGGIVMYDTRCGNSWIRTNITTQTANDRTMVNSVYVADWDDDGDDDILFGGAIDNSVRLYLNVGGSFSLKSVDTTLGDGIYAATMGDIIDGDKLEILVGTSAGAIYYYTYNSVLETFSRTQLRTISASQVRNIRAADLDNDGDVDYVVGGVDTGLLIFNNDDEEFLSNYSLITTSANNDCAAFTISDFNGDDFLDIVSACDSPNGYAGGDVVYWENQGLLSALWGSNTGAFTPSVVLTGVDMGVTSSFDDADLDSDGRQDVLTPAATTKKLYALYNNIETATVCALPVLFCDSFDYTQPIITKEWKPYFNDGSMSSVLTPTNNRLNLSIDDLGYEINHYTPIFDVDYSGAAGDHYEKSVFSCSFSSEFDLNILNESDNYMSYDAFQNYNQVVYSIKAKVEPTGAVSFYYYNNSQYNTLSGNTSIKANTVISMKINTYFADKPEFANILNTSNPSDRIDVYANGILLGSVGFNYPTAAFLGAYTFNKAEFTYYYVDNYKVMKGTSSIFDTSTSCYVPVYNENVSIDSGTITIGGSTKSGDLAPAVASMWYDMGLRSTGSRIIAGLFLMFILGLGLILMSMRTGFPMSPGLIITAELMFMILLTYIRLLPIWIPIVIGIVGASIAVLAAKNTMGG